MRNDSTHDLQLLLYFIITNYNINNIPIGLVSKNKIGALRTLPNMLLWSTRDECSTNRKNRTARKVPKIIREPTIPPYIPIRWSFDKEHLPLEREQFRLHSASHPALRDKTLIQHYHNSNLPISYPPICHYYISLI